MAIFRENDDVIKALRDEMPIFLLFSKLLRATYLFAKFCDLTHFQWDFKCVILPPPPPPATWSELEPKYLGGNRVKMFLLPI